MLHVDAATRLPDAARLSQEAENLSRFIEAVEVFNKEMQ